VIALKSPIILLHIQSIKDKVLKIREEQTPIFKISGMNVKLMAEKANVIYAKILSVIQILDIVICSCKV
jgi:hypothetical protein